MIGQFIRVWEEESVSGQVFQRIRWESMVVDRRKGITSSRDCIVFDNTTIEFEVRRSARRRKTVEIALEGSNVRVLAPSNLPADDVRRIVRKRAPWILERLADSPVGPSQRRFASGDMLPYLGRDVKMVVQAADVPAPEVHFSRHQLLGTEPIRRSPADMAVWGKVLSVSVPHGIEDTERVEQVRSAIAGWFKDRAAEMLPKKVDVWRPRLSIDERPLVLVRNQRSQWGSCSSDGTIRFSWRVMMLELPLIEYVVVHELAHLKVMDHSAAFWEVVSEVMPDAKDRRRRLGAVSRTLPL